MKKAGIYSLTFTVTNSQGLSVSVTRTLVVSPVCPPGEALCSNKVSFSCGLAINPLPTSCDIHMLLLMLYTCQNTWHIEKRCAHSSYVRATSDYLSFVVQVKQVSTYGTCVNLQSIMFV